MNKPSLNIVIPVLNEEKQLQQNVTYLIDYLGATELKDNFKITISDNGSDDATQSIAEGLKASFLGVVDYIRLSERGVGLAFRTAIEQNTSDIVGYMDLDLATDVSHLPEMYDAFCQGDLIVVGSRLLKDSRVEGRTLIREITSHGLNFILKHYLGVRFTDAMCGFKFYDRRAATYLVEKCSDSNGWFYCAEMMIRAEWDDIPIHELAVTWRDDADSKVKIGSLSKSYMHEIIRLKHERDRSA